MIFIYWLGYLALVIALISFGLAGIAAFASGLWVPGVIYWLMGFALVYPGHWLVELIEAKEAGR